MKRTKYGKSNNKVIYVSDKRAQEWQRIVDYATENNIGIGELLLDAWEKQQPAAQLPKGEDLRRKYGI